MSIKGDIGWRPYVPEREYLGVWDCKSKWDQQKHGLPMRARHEWLVENVVGDVDLDYIYRTEFFVNHVDPDDPEHITNTAILYRFAKNDEGNRYIMRDENGFVRDENGDSVAAKCEPIEVILKTEVPEELR